MEGQIFREIQTDFDTAVGFNPDAPFVGEESSSSSLLQDEVPGRQPEEGELWEEWVPTEAEKDAAVRAAEKSHLAAKAGGVKRPRSPPLSPNFDAVPDLHEIFDNYDTPANVRVSICRAYASYVSSTLPRKEKKQKRKR